MDEIRWCDHLDKTSSAVLSHGATYLVWSPKSDSVFSVEGYIKPCRAFMVLSILKDKAK